MFDPSEPVILCIASFFKGNEFIRECRRQGVPTVLLTREKLLEAAWARECIDGFFAVPGEANVRSYLLAATNVARYCRILRVVALEEYDVATAAHIREHLCIPGMDSTSAMRFQDKLVMRFHAESFGTPQPAFVSLINYQSLAKFMGEVEPPWMLKPRIGASSMGIRKVHTAEEVWRAVEELDRRENYYEQSPYYLLEQHVTGDVYHVDSLVHEGKVVFANVERYGVPPFEVAHFGGVTTSQRIPCDAVERAGLLELNEKLLHDFHFQHGVTHAEYIHPAHTQTTGSAPLDFCFLEVAARVGGAYTAETIEAATGIELWREWARIELSSPGRPYVPPQTRNDYSGIAIALARQEHPDTSGYTDPEIVYRVQKPWHVGLIVCSRNHDRVQQLLAEYVQRFNQEFTAFCPAEETPEYYLKNPV